MSKVKYYYDSETLSYRKIADKKTTRLKKLMLFILASFLFGMIGLLFLLNTSLVNTPRELSLSRELLNLEFQFEQLNKKMNQAALVLDNIESRDNTIYRVYFEANPIPEAQRKAGFGGLNRYKPLEGYEYSELITATAKKLDILQKQLVVQSKSLDEISTLASEKEALLSAIPSIQPISTQDLTRMASGFGWRSDPFNKVRKKHWGMDFTAPRGTPIYATGNGRISRADNNATGFGKHIRIEHGFGYITIYAHLSQYNSRRGQRVKRGDIIGYVGSTGRSEGPHLHYEVWKDKQRINPINFYTGTLSPKEFENLLRFANQENQSLD
ncbi:MAG: murein DD-endopeptidase MepM/ murein hydrolase activator NlpD [Flavobacteriaceae bacterium]|jgi:murein DD-endopeptidase MepM/ murein hydrolase activator NlpD